MLTYAAVGYATKIKREGKANIPEIAIAHLFLDIKWRFLYIKTPSKLGFYESRIRGLA